MNWSDILRHNLEWKVLSVVLSTLVWLTISSGIHGDLRLGGLGMATRTFERLPVTVLTAAVEPRGFKVDPPGVTLSVKGEAAIVNVLKGSEIEAYVNLTGGQDVQNLRKRIQIYLPKGVSLVRITPAFVDVTRTVPTPSP